MVSTSLELENINLWRIFQLIKIIIMRHYSTNLFKPILDYLTNERLKLQFCRESHLNKVHRGEVQSEYADPHLGDADTDDEQEAVAENGYGILRPDADYRSEVQPTIQQED